MRGDHPRQTLQLWSGLVDLYLYLKLHLSEQTTKSPLAAWIVGLYCPAVGAVTEQALLAVANAKHAAAVALTSFACVRESLGAGLPCRTDLVTEE